MANKTESRQLRDRGYHIPGLCGYCRFSNFEGPQALQGWGACDLHLHVPPKNKRAASPEESPSVHATGSCPQFEVNPGRVARTGLGTHKEFFDGGRREAHGS